MGVDAMMPEHRTIRRYDKLTTASTVLDNLFNQLSNLQLHDAANAVSSALYIVSRERTALHPEYVQALNRRES